MESSDRFRVMRRTEAARGGTLETISIHDRSLVRTHDALGRVAELRLDGAVAAAYTYEGAGPAAVVRYGNGLVETRTLDAVGRLARAGDHLVVSLRMLRVA